MSFINWNGNIMPEEQVCLSPDNLSFRYGDGCFETMKIVNGRLVNAPLHFQRLTSSLQILQLSCPLLRTQTAFQEYVIGLLQQNDHNVVARVRLTVYREEEDKTTPDGNASFIIQSWQENPTTNLLNDKGLTLDFYPHVRISCDTFSQLKSNNYLPYISASRWTKEKQLDDTLLLNSHDRISDSTKANIFIVTHNGIMTPPLKEGCIAGTMRRYLLNCLSEAGIRYYECPLTEIHLQTAEEIFLTNAIYGIRWISRFRQKEYGNKTAQQLHKRFIEPLFT